MVLVVVFLVLRVVLVIVKVVASHLILKSHPQDQQNHDDHDGHDDEVLLAGSGSFEASNCLGCALTFLVFRWFSIVSLRC